MQSPISPRPRVLLVENDPMVRQTITFLLQDHYAVAHTSFVEFALEQLVAPDLPANAVVMLDCRLPPADVAEVLTAADRRRTPVLLISGDPTQAHTVDITRRFLAKPFTQEALLSALDSTRR